jgi:hypothetical protein
VPSHRFAATRDHEITSERWKTIPATTTAIDDPKFDYKVSVLVTLFNKFAK